MRSSPTGSAGSPALNDQNWPGWLRHVRRGDTVRVSSMDRLARSVIDLAQIIHELNGNEVEVEFTTERLTFAPGAEDPFAMFQLHMLGAVAQLERSLIKERQREGIDLARAKGVYRGRSRALSPEQITQAHDMVNTGIPKAKIARELGCSRRVLYDALSGSGVYCPDRSQPI
jgi:DNA invertase Pin-like site-specific DNA recombinase